jgi:type II secretion system protein N
VKAAVYVLYALLFAGALLLWRFPYQSLEQWVEAAVRAHVHLRLDLAGVSPTLPPGLKSPRLLLRSLNSGGEPVFEAAEPRVHPLLLPLARGRAGLAFHALAYGGAITGEVFLEPFSGPGHCRLRLNWHAVELQQHPGLSRRFGPELAGKIHGELLLGGCLEDPTGLSGSGELNLKEGNWAGRSGYLSDRTIADLDVSIAVQLHGGILTLSQCRFSARGLEGSLSGTVKLEPRLTESALDVTGVSRVDRTLVNRAALTGTGLGAVLEQNKPIPFHLGGTLGTPRLRLF